MDLSGTSVVGANVDELLASLGGGSGSGARKGVWFEVGDEKSQDFFSYRRFSDNEIEFKEYDDMGMVVDSGFATFSDTGGRIEFDAEFDGNLKEKVEGWFAMELTKERALVFVPWRLVSDFSQVGKFMRVFNGFLHLKEAEMVIDEDGGGFENNGIGLSGEEEARGDFVMVRPGKLKSK